MWINLLQDSTRTARQIKRPTGNNADVVFYIPAAAACLRLFGTGQTGHCGYCTRTEDAERIAARLVLLMHSHSLLSTVIDIQLLGYYDARLSYLHAACAFCPSANRSSLGLVLNLGHKKLFPPVTLLTKAKTMLVDTQSEYRVLQTHASLVDATDA